jgi:uncharacterized membrane protein YbhN (UPF0104 family)
MNEGIRPELTRKSGFLKVTIQLFGIAMFVLAIVHFMRKYSADISSLQYLSLPDILMIGTWSFVSYGAYAYAVYVVFVDLGLKGLGPFAWLRIYFVSRLVNFLVTQGGNLYRLVLLKKKHNFSYTNSIGVTAFLVWINALIALTASTYFLAGFERNSYLHGVSLLSWSVLALVVMLLGPLLIVWSIQSFRRSSIWQSRMLRPFANIADFFTASLKNGRLLAQLTILSTVHFCFFVGVNYFSFQAIDQPVDLAIVCIFTTAFVFTRYINVVPGNIGLSELVGGLVSEQMGVGFGNGLLVSGIVRIVEVIMILLIGLIYGQFMVFNYFARR